MELANKKGYMTKKLENNSIVCNKYCTNNWSLQIFSKKLGSFMELILKSFFNELHPQLQEIEKKTGCFFLFLSSARTGVKS